MNHTNRAILILALSVATMLVLLPLKASGEPGVTGEVKLRGTAVTDEQWRDLLGYGSYYWCNVTVVQILSDPDMLLSISGVVTICYNSSLAIETGDSVECYGYYYKMVGPVLYVGNVACIDNGYYAIPEFSIIVLFFFMTAIVLTLCFFKKESH
jgi:hypothetical protein